MRKTNALRAQSIVWKKAKARNAKRERSLEGTISVKNTTEPSASVFKNTYYVTSIDENFISIITHIGTHCEDNKIAANKKPVSASATNHSSRSTSPTIGSPDC